MTAPITREGSTSFCRIASEKANISYTPKEIVNETPPRNEVLPGGGLAIEDYDLIHPPTTSDCIITSPKWSSQGRASPKWLVQGDVGMTEVLPFEPLPAIPNSEILTFTDGQLQEDIASVFNSRKKKRMSKKSRKSHKRMKKERILEDSSNHDYNFTEVDQNASIPVLSFTPTPSSGNLMECQEISSGAVTGSVTVEQLAQHNLLENIPEFPKVESFGTVDNTNMLLPCRNPFLNELPALDAAPLLPAPDNWVCKEEQDMKQNLEKTIRFMCGGATPHMVAVGVGGRDEINVKADRKTLTANRVRRLDILSRTTVTNGGLSTQEENEKKRLLKLEKNRRAAQISREKKKRYILNLEGRAAMMGKHLAALELENNQLRALLLSLYKRSNARRSNTTISAPARIIPKVEPMND